jgi:D-glycero-D-manno-heptose 1,7-bisphosphate phosphatase
MQSDKRKAIFLDRDGVLIKERGDYTWLLEDMIINEGVAEVLLTYQSAGYLLIVISNQGGIGKSLYTKQEADFLHFHLSRYLSVKGIQFAEVYYCPHHPETGKCLCRKPLSLMIEKAIARFEIDPAQSFFIGDTDRDIEAGHSAGVKPYKLPVNGRLPDLELLSL